MDELQLSLEGPRGEMAASCFLTAAQAMLKLLDGASREKVAWQVSTLAEGSLRIGLVASRSGDSGDPEQAVDTVLRGLATLHESSTIPHGFTLPMMSYAQQLAGVRGKGGITEISVSVGATLVKIDEVLARNAEEAVASKVVSIGSVQGILDKVNFRKVREFGLIDERTGAAMRVTFGPELDEAVKQSIDTPVVVTGTLSRNATGQKVTMRARTIASLAKQPPRPVEQLVGILGDDWTGGLDSVDFIRAQRG
ncbi:MULTISPECIES: hypothetical protein [unclassified Kribbella]|uniref:hypothetical protein n=1 Tax=unclassified Kribbella TaxID=2644121 RepID=UPI0033C1DB52